MHPTNPEAFTDSSSSNEHRIKQTDVPTGS